ncbi:dihydrofolate reductase family protein [uncultured Rhodospira sp.]|uniref:dihydrofolate reductase family protein n=1 Tax=uncultured Rhodospira sp. TaxID=1936189 RepID=UPI002618FAE7|nr:dihydrofolate reductase family protein [uncultured Rhodospira sp.]
MGAMVRLYSAVSLDGFIATPEGGVEWLAPFDDQDLGYADFYARVGLLVMGRATYEQTLSFGPWPYTDKPCWVLTSRPLDGDIPNGVARWQGDIPGLMRRAREHDDGDTWVVGGARTIALFLTHGRVDQIDMFVVPTWLGQGLPLFPEVAPRLLPTLVRSQQYAGGVVQLTYRTRSPFDVIPASG